MKILTLYGWFAPPGRHGAFDRLCGMHRHLAGLGHDMTFLYFVPENLVHLRDFSRACTAMQAIGSRLEVIVTDPENGYFFSMCRLMAYMRKCRPQVVHIDSMPNGALLACCCAQLFLPGAFSFHFLAGYGHAKERLNRWPYRLLYGLAHRSLDRVVYLSREFHAVRKAAARARNTSFLNIGTLLRRFDRDWLHAGTRLRTRRALGIPAATRVIGFVAYLRKQKGGEDLLHAVRTLLDGSHDVRVLVVGDGPARSSLEDTARRLNIGEHVIFTGFRDDVEYVQANFTFQVFPSRMEGTPHVIMQAMALGVPTISYRVGGIPALIESGRDGWLVEEGDVCGLTKAIAQYLERPDQVERHGARARAKVRERFQAGCHLAKMARFIEDIRAGTVRSDYNDFFSGRDDRESPRAAASPDVLAT